MKEAVECGIVDGCGVISPYWTSRDGRHTIYNADCLEVLPTLAAGSVDAVVTDPPYGIFAHGGKWGKKQDLQWDKEPSRETHKLLGISREVIIWGGNYFPLPPSRGWLVWFKRDAVPSASSVELA